MGKACIWLLGVAVTLFIAYASIAATTKGSAWYLNALWIGFITTGILGLLLGLVYLLLLGKKRISPLDILNDWRCTYWPTEKQLKVVLWFRDHSNISTFSVKCVAQFEQQVVQVDDDVTIGGTYFSKAGLKSGQDQPMMVEFLKHNVELHNASMATIWTRIKPSYGVWAAKQRTKVVSVQVINR